MQCPFCNSETKVSDSRVLPESTVRRRRECIKCHRRFKTLERIDEIENVKVLKLRDKQESFRWEKLQKSIATALRRRVDDEETHFKITADVYRELMSRGNRSEITSKEIGDEVMKKLLNVDPVAYIRFASVYKTFTSIDDFVNMVRQTEAAMKKM